MNKLRWIFWGVCYLLRVVLIVVGVFLPLHIGYNTPRTKGMGWNIWRRYVENCFRNPTPYLRGLFKQPKPEVKPNPDEVVRNIGDPAADRTMVSGPYIEYWKLSKRDMNKKRPYWEKRIGWKFVDDEPTFWPTFQLGPRA